MADHASFFIEEFQYALNRAGNALVSTRIIRTAPDVDQLSKDFNLSANERKRVGCYENHEIWLVLRSKGKLRQIIINFAKVPAIEAPQNRAAALAKEILNPPVTLQEARKVSSN